jgi:hypothetical protein
MGIYRYVLTRHVALMNSLIPFEVIGNGDLNFMDTDINLNFDDPSGELGFDFESFLHDEPGMDFNFDSNFEQGLGLETSENA